MFVWLLIMDSSHCGEIKSNHHCMASVDASGSVCGAIICAIFSSSFGNDDGIFRCSHHSTGSKVATDSTSSRPARGKGTPVTLCTISAPSCVTEKVGKNKNNQ
jgi:hypothetical protein